MIEIKDLIFPDDLRSKAPGPALTEHETAVEWAKRGFDFYDRWSREEPPKNA